MAALLCSRHNWAPASRIGINTHAATQAHGRWSWRISNQTERSHAPAPHTHAAARIPMPPPAMRMPLSYMCMLPPLPMRMLLPHWSCTKHDSCSLIRALTLHWHIHKRQQRYRRRPGPTELRESSEMKRLLKYKRNCCIMRFKKPLLRRPQRFNQSVH